MNGTSPLVLLVVLFGFALGLYRIARKGTVTRVRSVGAGSSPGAIVEEDQPIGPVAGPVWSEHSEYPDLFGSAPAIPARKGLHGRGQRETPFRGVFPLASPVGHWARRAADGFALSLWRRLTPRQRSNATYRATLLTPAARAANADA